MEQSWFPLLINEITLQLWGTFSGPWDAGQRGTGCIFFFKKQHIEEKNPKSLASAGCPQESGGNSHQLLPQPACSMLELSPCGPRNPQSSVWGQPRSCCWQMGHPRQTPWQQRVVSGWAQEGRRQRSLGHWAQGQWPFPADLDPGWLEAWFSLRSWALHGQCHLEQSWWQDVWVLVQVPSVPQSDLFSKVFLYLEKLYCKVCLFLHLGRKVVKRMDQERELDM